MDGFSLEYIKYYPLGLVAGLEGAAGVAALSTIPSFFLTRAKISSPGGPTNTVPASKT